MNNSDITSFVAPYCPKGGIVGYTKAQIRKITVLFIDCYIIYLFFLRTFSPISAVSL